MRPTSDVVQFFGYCCEVVNEFCFFAAMRAEWHRIMFEIGLWDIILIVGVSLQATAMAYIFSPRWKALLYSLPIPFTLASMSLGKPVGVTHVAGLLVLLGFFHIVRFLYQDRNWNIVLSTVVGAISYTLIGAGLARVLPQGPWAFWITVMLCGAVGLTLFLKLPHRSEPGHRSPLPVWIKVPTVVGVITFLVLSKQYLSGFMPMFPMMGIITAYEGRHSLWTMTCQVPVLLLTFLPLMSFCRLVQPQLGLGFSLALGWPVHLATLSLITRWQWQRSGGDGPEREGNDA